MTTRTITFDDAEWQVVPKQLTPEMLGAALWPACLSADYALALAAAPEPPAQQPMTAAATDVLAERRRQVEVEGWTPEHDDKHASGDLATAAGCYALHAALLAGGYPDAFKGIVPSPWPWSAKWWKPGDPRRTLVKAGALILAEIERLDRVAKGERNEG